MLATVLAITDREHFPELFERGKGILENIQYPSLEKLTAGWDKFGKKEVSV